MSGPRFNIGDVVDAYAPLIAAHPTEPLTLLVPPLEELLGEGYPVLSIVDARGGTRIDGLHDCMLYRGYHYGLSGPSSKRYLEEQLRPSAIELQDIEKKAKAKFIYIQ